MDLIDRRLLTLLDENARLPTSTLAKRLKISRQVAEYRIGQLKKQGIIRNFTTLIDPTKFVQNIWHIYVKLQNLTSQREAAILAHVQQERSIWWIAECQGEWDLIFSAAGNDVIAFDELLARFRSRFHENINELQVTTLITADAYPRGHFLNVERRRVPYIGARDIVSIGVPDRAILNVLATHARSPSTEIARKTKLTARQVIYRIKELEKKGVIRAYRLHLDAAKLGLEYYKVTIYTQDLTSTTERSIQSWCEKNPNIIFSVKKIAPWNLEIELETQGYRALNAILKELRNTFGHLIKRTDTTLITEEHKGELDILRAV